MASTKRKHAPALAEVVIPDKIYFRIGEVSDLADLPTYVLRFWESEFPQLRPSKSSSGQRMYRRRDVEYVLQIRKLLYEDGFTIAGARERLREMRQAHSEEALATSAADAATAMPVAPAVEPDATFSGNIERESLRRLRQQLDELLALLS